MKVLVLDIGNSKTKCYVFSVESELKVTVIHNEIRLTNRGHPWDLIDTCRNMVHSAVKAHQPDAGMITAFGDAFVYYDPENNGMPRFVFADESAESSRRAYQSFGFPAGDIEITGVHSLRLKHAAEWNNIVPVNVAIGAALCKEEDSFRSWDFTQASASGDFNFLSKTGVPVCNPYDIIGCFEGMPILAGGLDNAFLDTVEQTPYIVAGTWLVVSTIHDDFKPTETQRQHGVRWLVSGNGRYLAQTVRRSERPLSPNLPDQILADFQAMGIGGGEPQKIRVLGSYSKELSKKLNTVASEGYFDFRFQDYGEQHKSAAVYVYQSLK